MGGLGTCPVHEGENLGGAAATDAQAVSRLPSQRQFVALVVKGDFGHFAEVGGDKRDRLGRRDRRGVDNFFLGAGDRQHQRSGHKGPGCQ